MYNLYLCQLISSSYWVSLFFCKCQSQNQLSAIWWLDLDLMVITMIRRKIKYLLNENNSSISKRGADVTGKKYVDEVKKNRSAWYHMMSCMANDIVYEFQKFNSAKTMWEVSNSDTGSCRRYIFVPSKLSWKSLIVSVQRRLQSTCTC